MKGLLVSLVVASFAGAHAYSLFDFESEAATSDIGSGSPGALTSVTMTDNGLTLELYREGGATFDIWDATSTEGFFPLTWETRVLDPFANLTTDDWFIGNFSSAVKQVEVEMTDFGSDEDELVMEVYSGLDATGTLIATKTLSWGGNSSPSYMALGWSSVFESGAARSIRFRGGVPDFPNSMYYDNIAATPVPEPASFAALLLGGAALLRRRNR
ncbi:MAG: PEP-CTERM sorting domain-containing protein [Fimbriimonadaceae bacterium]|nr:PEP-CTERM sorting domain-containing protein [Chthonomonadaceae bacterium]MCO5295245.1 PEP-CTERM sorting domain-containing protein [Fimbriimonadaceae bacterium]